MGFACDSLYYFYFTLYFLRILMCNSFSSSFAIITESVMLFKMKLGEKPAKLHSITFT